MRILLQPASGKDAQKHFEDTISNGVFVSSLQNKVSPDIYSKLQELNERYIRVWGIVPSLDGNPRRQWLDLKQGDIVLFYANKEFYYLAKVYLKIHNPSLAEELWGFDNDGRTWEYIYFISEGKQIQLTYNPKVLEYMPNHIVQGAILLDEFKSSAMLSYIKEKSGEIVDEDKIEPTVAQELDFIRQVRIPNTPQEAEEELARISTSIKDEPVKERIMKAKVLARNARFARLIKERVAYICEICGQKPFIQKSGLPFAEAHHKYELAKSRIDNPKDMLCVCPLCHKIIHYGNDESLNQRIIINK